MKRLPLPLGIDAAEKLDRSRLGRGSESKHRHISLFSIAADLICDHVLHIAEFLITGTERQSDCRHIFTGSRRMRFVDDNGETLVFQPGNAVHNIWKFLNGRRYDLCVSV